MFDTCISRGISIDILDPLCYHVAKFGGLHGYRISAFKSCESFIEDQFEKRKLPLRVPPEHNRNL